MWPVVSDGAIEVTVSYGKGPKAKATKLHSLVVRARGACEKCGESQYTKLQCAHIVGRRYNATRTDENNAFCLCASCHRRFTDWPLEFAAFVVEKIGEDGYQALRDKAQRAFKVNDAYWIEECVRLQMLLNEAAA